MSFSFPLLLAAAVAAQPPVLAGLDHVPVAVNDLDAAAARYRALGFALKPGQPHANGIRNWHAKFQDGTEIELITAPAARDPLTTTYRRHLAQGDGPAFLALHAPNGNPNASAGPIPPYIFFGKLNHSPTDRTEHFAHANTATSLVSVWLAADEFTAERRLLAAAGVAVAPQAVLVPERVEAQVARLGRGEIVFLPARRQLVAGRRIVGMTVEVRSLDAVTRALAAGGVNAPAPIGRSIFLPPGVALGYWLELREARPSTSRS